MLLPRKPNCAWAIFNSFVNVISASPWLSLLLLVSDTKKVTYRANHQHIPRNAWKEGLFILKKSENGKSFGDFSCFFCANRILVIWQVHIWYLYGLLRKSDVHENFPCSFLCIHGVWMFVNFSGRDGRKCRNCNIWKLQIPNKGRSWEA